MREASQVPIESPKFLPRASVKRKRVPNSYLRFRITTPFKQLITLRSLVQIQPPQPNFSVHESPKVPKLVGARQSGSEVIAGLLNYMEAVAGGSSVLVDHLIP